MRIGVARGLDHFVRRFRGRGAVGDVAKHGVVEENGVLAHDAGERAQGLEPDLLRVDAVEENAAVRRLVEARNEIDERALPRSARSHECHDVATTRAKRDVDQHRILVVREADVLELDPFAHTRYGSRAAIRLCFGWLVEHGEEPLRRGERLLGGGRHLRKLFERGQQPHHDDHERDQPRTVHRLAPGKSLLRADPEDENSNGGADELREWLGQKRHARDAGSAGGIRVARARETRILVRFAAE